MDESLVAELYQANVRTARAFAVAVTGDPVTAEDLVQDAFIRCVRRFPGLRDRDAFRTYLLRAVANGASSHYRRRQVEHRHLARLAGSASPGEPGYDPPDRGEHGALVAALRSLPVRQRTAVAARFLLDWSEAQTAEAMNCRVGTVKSLTSRGIAALRAQLTKESSPHA